MDKRIHWTAQFLVLAILCALPPILAPGAAGPPRVVAIGDVHGAYAELVAVLQRTMLMDANRRWTGGSATFIQIGDILDRGERVRDCLELIMDLERQAEKAGGKVIPLLGNHEMMNLMHDLRYLTPEIYRTFATEKSERVRQQAWREYLNFASALRARAPGVVVASDDASRQKWMEAHPPGFFEYLDAMGPEGRYGRWIRRHRVIVQVGDGLFVHGGLSPNLKFRNLTDLDRQAGLEMATFDAIWRVLSENRILWRYMTLDEALPVVFEEWKRIQASGQIDDPAPAAAMQALLAYDTWLTCSADGLLWYRDLAQEPEEKLAEGLTAMLKRLKVQYIVGGHTVQSGFEIIARFAGRVFLIDTGMNKKVFEGRPAALEIHQGRFTALYLDGESKVLPAPEIGK